MSDVRVLHVFKYFRPAFTGEGIFLERLAPLMHRLHPGVVHDVLVTATPRPTDTYDGPGIRKIHYLSSPGRRPCSQWRLVTWLARHSSDYDVVHHHTHVDRTFAGAIALKLRQRRVILSATLDDSIPGLLGTYRRIWRPLVRRLLGLIDSFVAISPKLQVENREFAADKTIHIPMGIPLPRAGENDRVLARAKLGLPPASQILVSVGGLCARKDQLFLIRELADILKAVPDRRLILIGPTVEAEYRTRLEAEIVRLKLSDHVALAGYQEPWAYYSAADMFVFASQEEGFGTVAIEAMAHGLPVILRRLQGVNDTFVESGTTGWLFDSGDELRGAVGRLLNAPCLRQEMGGKARKAAKNFDIYDAVARYLMLYDPEC